jgi:hypothetical protein
MSGRRIAGRCDGWCCLRAQVTQDRTSCYACGNVGSLIATFYGKPLVLENTLCRLTTLDAASDPSSTAFARPETGVTMIMHSGMSTDPTQNRWFVVRLICDDSARGPGVPRELHGGNGGIYEIAWRDPAGCPGM